MILLYTHTVSPRLEYIISFFSKEVFNTPLTITTDKENFKIRDGVKINYSESPFSEEEFFIKAAPLLFEKGITPQPIDCFEVNYHKAFFQGEGDYPFDVFAATFYLLSRYEEYLPHDKDEYGRFAFTSSLAHREEFLDQPLVDCWLEEFSHALQRKYANIVLKRRQFKCTVSYDIDIAYAYLHKGWHINAAGLLRSILSGEWTMAKDRWQVLKGKKRDPYDCFEWLDALHLYCRTKPTYFFLVAGKQSNYDKNTSTAVQAYRELIEYYASSYQVGLHPSWRSNDETNLLIEEREWLEVVTDKAVDLSRQHYIRMTLPVTYRRLLAAGIRRDFSMGYGSVNGFRASVSSPFNWYDLEEEKQTGLVIYPFCFMDANSYYEARHSPQQAYLELMKYYQRVKKVNGSFITIWHNNILGTYPGMEGWREMFELFMKETVYWDAYYEEA